MPLCVKLIEHPLHELVAIQRILDGHRVRVTPGITDPLERHQRVCDFGLLCVVPHDPLVEFEKLSTSAVRPPACRPRHLLLCQLNRPDFSGDSVRWVLRLRVA
jgi:hypothetical protein